MEEADEDATSEKKSDNGDVTSLLSGSDDEERVNNKVSEFQWDPFPTISWFWAIF